MAIYTESDVEAALNYLQENSQAKIATVARQFGLPRSTLRSRLEGRTSVAERPPPPGKLSEAEEDAICRYIDRLDSINLAVRPEFVRGAANLVLKEGASIVNRDNPPTVSARWVTRFLQRHGYTKRIQQKLEQDRQIAEDPARVSAYFDKLLDVIAEEGIAAADIWNMDETGFRIGVGKDQVIVTKRKKKHYFGLPQNRETATAIEAISAGGHYCPAYLILSGVVHMESWYRIEELDDSTRLAVSRSGYSNDEIALDWIGFFDRYTRQYRTGAKRLLIVDGHGSHHTKEFIQYCDDHEIIPFGLPPHLTHLLQPLDVVVFQPLKHYHAKALDVIVRDGCTNISKLEFLSVIEDIRKQAFKRETIVSAFRKTGISPFNPEKVLADLRARNPKEATPPPAEDGLQSSPFATPVKYRHFLKAHWELEALLAENNVPDEVVEAYNTFAKGALTNVVEGIHTKRDLAATQYAQIIAKQRRAHGRSRLQNGGILTVKDGRHIVKDKEEQRIEKQRKSVAAYDRKRKAQLQHTATPTTTPVETEE